MPKKKKKQDPWIKENERLNRRMVSSAKSAENALEFVEIYPEDPAALRYLVAMQSGAEEAFLAYRRHRKAS